MLKSLNFLTEYNWSIVFDNGTCDKNDIYLNLLFVEGLNNIVTRIKVENNSLTVYYAIPEELPVQDISMQSTAIMKLLTSDCMREIFVYVRNQNNEDQFIIKNKIRDKKPTYEMVFGSINSKVLELIVHYEVFEQTIV